MRARVGLPVIVAIALGLAPAAPGTDSGDAGSASADGGGSVADAGDAADASNDAGDDAGEAGAEVPTESLPFVGPVPDEKSKPPKPAEWEAEKDLGKNGRHFTCAVRRVREWLRVRCDIHDVAMIELVSGLKTDVYFSIREDAGPCFDELDPGAGTGQKCWDIVEVVFPIRRGDRRIFQVMEAQVGGPYGGQLTLDADIVISETWLDGDPGPIVTVLD